MGKLLVPYIINMYDALSGSTIPLTEGPCKISNLQKALQLDNTEETYVQY